ncbi:type II toxin-antitoxin system YafQ family toxin [Helicobacter sp.]|uniref:type II toxin-antitoxin system RelE/ParE family toxin n=1 Tax=Helicobacter sp. TaxID=218 RepID=UPI00198776F9|nr:type II toxin-antitoxin system YafQ family toxin [Helicobacter sp.]MBD5164367.1 type II toxin-antitoxin system YafQ family toxin [Helicobacter sp.]
MLEIVIKKSFQKDYDRLLLNGFDDTPLQEVIVRLQTNNPLPQKYKNHQLKGIYKDFKECHIKPDILLLYQIKDCKLFLIRLGSHSDLF